MSPRDTYDHFAPPERGLFGENELSDRRGSGCRVTGASNLVDLTLIFRDEKPASIAVTDPASGKRVDSTKPTDPWIWLPKSQIEFEHGAGGAVTVTMPRWLAREKGLI